MPHIISIFRLIKNSPRTVLVHLAAIASLIFGRDPYIVPDDFSKRFSGCSVILLLNSPTKQFLLKLYNKVKQTICFWKNSYNKFNNRTTGIKREDKQTSTCNVSHMITPVISPGGRWTMPESGIMLPTFQIV